MASQQAREHGQMMRSFIAAYVASYFRHNGRGPTHEEVASAADVSKTRAFQLVHGMIEAGHLVRDPGKNRTLRPPEDTDDE